MAKEALTDREKAILALESAWPVHSGTKEEAIRSQLEMPPARYYLLLGRLIETERALAYDPMLTQRLRRLREQRIRARAARTAS